MVTITKYKNVVIKIKLFFSQDDKLISCACQKSVLTSLENALINSVRKENKQSKSLSLLQWYILVAGVFFSPFNIVCVCAFVVPHENLH